jgi:hypothetical protein
MVLLCFTLVCNYLARAWLLESDFGAGKKFRRKDYREREKTGDFLPINSHEMEVILESEGDLDYVPRFLPDLL